MNVARLTFDGDGLLGRKFESKDRTLYPHAGPSEIPSLLCWSQPLSEKTIPEIVSQSNVEHLTPLVELRNDEVRFESSLKTPPTVMSSGGGSLPMPAVKSHDGGVPHCQQSLKSQASTQDAPLLQDSQASENLSILAETSQGLRQQPVERSSGSPSGLIHDVPSKATDGHNPKSSSVPAETRSGGGMHSFTKSCRSPSSFKHDDSSTDTRKQSPEILLRLTQHPLRKARVRLPPIDSSCSPMVKRIIRAAENRGSTDADTECVLRSYEFDRQSRSPPPLSPALLPEQGRPAALVRLPRSSSSAPTIQPGEVQQDYSLESTWDHDRTRDGGTTGHLPAHLITRSLRQSSPSPLVIQGETQRSSGKKPVHMSLRQYGHPNTDNVPCENSPTIMTALSSIQTDKQLESPSVLVLPQVSPKTPPTNEQGAEQRGEQPFVLPTVPAPEKDGNRIIRTFTIANMPPSEIEAAKPAEAFVASIQSPSNNEAARPAAYNASESPLQLGQDKTHLVETYAAPSSLPSEKRGARLARELNDLKRHLGDIITKNTQVVLSTSRRGKPCDLFEDICYESLKSYSKVNSMIGGKKSW